MARSILVHADSTTFLSSRSVIALSRCSSHHGCILNRIVLDHRAILDGRSILAAQSTARPIHVAAHAKICGEKHENGFSLGPYLPQLLQLIHPAQNLPWRAHKQMAVCLTQLRCLPYICPCVKDRFPLVSSFTCHKKMPSSLPLNFQCVHALTTAASSSSSSCLALKLRRCAARSVDYLLWR